MTGPGRRVLMAFPETGYFRFYGSTIRTLGDRGWEVLLAFDRPDKRGGPTVPSGAGPTVRSLDAIPEVAARALWALRDAMDYARYLESPFERTGYLRRRSARVLSPRFAWLARVRRVPRALVTAAIAGLRALDALVPADARLVAWIRSAAPDVVFLSPLVILGAPGNRQTELMKAARAAGVPVMVGVASWDHLTSKGLVRQVPEALVVWNRTQAAEAVDLHRVPPARIVMTGAQSLDHWFGSGGGEPGVALRARFGIDERRCVVLFVGSSRNMAPGQSEVDFVRRWIAALRGSTLAAVRNAFIVIRPHPTNAGPWTDVSLGDDVIVHPATYSGIPLTDDEVETFRQTMLAANAVVGINTTAMIEAAILERPVLSVRDELFAHSQAETVHFGYLSLDGGGCALVADTLTAHVAQIEEVIRHPVDAVSAARRFVESFVRPLGPQVAAAEHVCDAIEAVASGAGNRSPETTREGNIVPPVASQANGRVPR